MLQLQKKFSSALKKGKSPQAILDEADATPKAAPKKKSSSSRRRSSASYFPSPPPITVISVLLLVLGPLVGGLGYFFWYVNSLMKHPEYKEYLRREQAKAEKPEDETPAKKNKKAKKPKA